MPTDGALQVGHHARIAAGSLPHAFVRSRQRRALRACLQCSAQADCKLAYGRRVEATDAKRGHPEYDPTGEQMVRIARVEPVVSEHDRGCQHASKQYGRNDPGAT